MTKKKILIASILKPVNDTRMYEKMGVSLAKSGTYEVNILGYAIKQLPIDKRINFHPIFNFPRLSFKRILAGKKCYGLLKKLNPEVLIINTHELLLTAVWYKLFNKTQLIYDVRENYYRNILHTTTFPIIIKPLLATWVRFKEYLSHLFVDHYFLAEQSYEQEFSFTKGKSTVLENKYQPIEGLTLNSKRDVTQKQLLFSGTLAESTGVFHAINLAKSLYEIDQSISLDIIGFSPIPKLVDRIKSEIKSYDYISLIGGNELISHEEIINKIHGSNFGIICYPYNKSTINSTPTKLYEYLANQLPIITQDHHQWESICEEHSAGIVIDFEHYSPEDVLKSMESQLYYTKGKNEQLLWSDEESKLIDIIENNIL
jgi:glycosyltransferase involved in cell wall biosynthesis